MTKVTAKTDTGDTLVANYTYDNDLLTEIKTGSTTYSFTYGNFGQTSSIKVGSQVLAAYSYTYENNYLEKLAYGNGDSVIYTYDKQGRVTKQTYEDGETVQYLYDNDGELAAVVDSESGITSYTSSDFTDRNVQYREIGDDYEASLTYTYNKNNLITKIVENTDEHKRNIVISYDDDNRVATWRKYYSRVAYTYDLYSRVSEMLTHHTNTGLDVMSEYYTYYSPVNGMTSSLVSDYQTKSEGNYDVTYSYTYDDNGNILSVSDGTYTTTYVYDSANQLLRENNQAEGKTWGWTYDDAGNILSRSEYDYTTGTVGTDPDAVTYTYGNSSWGDLLTAYNGQTIEYDGIGNPTNDGTWEYTWKHGRELASMSDGTSTWNYTYNADGLRTKRTDGTDTYEYVYLDGQLVKLTVNDSGTEVVMYFAYDADGTPLSISYNGVTYYYVTNIQGDVVGILTSSGNLAVSYTYDAWGNVLSATGLRASTVGKYNPLRYRGYVYDTETQLYYLQSRYYDPEIGRFINADGYASTGQGLLGNNMFTYCLNNPVAYCDTTGELVGSACAIVIASGAAIGALTGAFSAAATGGSILEGAIEGLFLGGAGAACGLFLQGGVALLAGAAAGAVIDVLTQGIVQYASTGSLNIGSIDGGRVLKNATLTGFGTLIPQWGKATDDIIAACGTAVIWADTSAVTTCADVIITNTLVKESQTTSANNKMISYKREVILEGILETL